jgi:hypothetical protein
MRFLKSLLCLLVFFTFTWANAQRIIYSEPDRDDSRRMNFDVIGKISGNFLVYKNLRGKNAISIYNNNMQQIAREPLDYMPAERLINVDFFPYSDFSYMVYEYQRKNVVYCDAVKIDGQGKRISDIMQLDSSHIGFSSNDKIYSAISSEDRNKILVYKVNSRNKSNYIITTLLFNNTLNLLKRSRLDLPMQEQNDYLGDFAVDNDGDVVFTKFIRNASDNIGNTWFFWKEAQSDSLMTLEITKEKIYLDEVHVKVDNVNKRYFLTSFYYKERRGNIEGLYYFVWDKKSKIPVLENTVILGEELRKEARGDANAKMAFNDYFIRDILIKGDGGFAIGAEAYYTSSRYNTWNRYNYLYGYPTSMYDYYTYSPLYSNWMWRNRVNNGQAVRYHADNITVLSFDSSGNLVWSDVIHKEQFDDESDDRISYKLMNTGGQAHFLFNLEEKRALLLNDYSVDASGQLNRNPTLHNLDKGYEFLPKYAKQVSSRQMIIPCFHNNYICFAKLEYN